MAPMQTGSRVITVVARPEAVQVEPARCAVLVIDMQNDFGARGGMFDRAGIDISPVERAVEPTARVLAAARSAGLPVVYLQMQHRHDLADAGGPDAPHRIKHRPLAVGEAVTAPDGRASRILVAGTWNTEILPRLAPTRATWSSRSTATAVSSRRTST
jgi:ureidoacrylate peracid hydrolase